MSHVRLLGPAAGVFHIHLNGQRIQCRVSCHNHQQIQITTHDNVIEFISCASGEVVVVPETPQPATQPSTPDLECKEEFKFETPPRPSCKRRLDFDSSSEEEEEYVEEDAEEDENAGEEEDEESYDQEQEDETFRNMSKADMVQDDRVLEFGARKVTFRTRHGKIRTLFW